MMEGVITELKPTVIDANALYGVDLPFGIVWTGLLTTLEMD
jgi:hypothetical protein